MFDDVRDLLSPSYSRPLNSADPIPATTIAIFEEWLETNANPRFPHEVSLYLESLLLCKGPRETIFKLLSIQFSKTAFSEVTFFHGTKLSTLKKIKSSGHIRSRRGHFCFLTLNRAVAELYGNVILEINPLKIDGDVVIDPDPFLNQLYHHQSRFEQLMSLEPVPIEAIERIHFVKRKADAPLPPNLYLPEGVSGYDHLDIFQLIAEAKS